MAAAQVPKALVERLGSDATQGLVSLLESRQAEWSDEVLTTVVDRFEHRLAVDLSAVRVDVSRELSALRVDVARDLSALRVELLKWSFLLWVGQVATMAGLLAFMLR
ncbi:MAG TPA: hypothetical protein VMS40_11190 [Vicinamibacterales bacterium]|nr:hypothetical protein [Vicinamibacterales bacterium]